MSLARPDLRRSLVLHWLTLYVVVLFAVPARLIVAPLGSAGAPSMFLGLVSALLWFLIQLSRSTTDDGPRWPIRVALGIFLGCVGLSYAIAMARPIDPAEVSPADLALLLVVAWSGVLLMAHDGPNDMDSVSTLARRFAFAGGLMACVGLAQVVTGRVLVDLIAIPGLRATGGIETTYRYGLLRMSGTAASPIEFGALLTILFPVAIHNSLYPTGRSLVIRWFPVVAISLSLALSLSRTAYVGAAIALLVLLLGWPRRLRWGAIAIVALGSALMAVMAPRVFRAVRSIFVTAQDDPSITSRTESYDVVWQFFWNSPFFGRGLGTFLPKYRILDNQYLGLLVNVGLLGLLAFLGIFAVAIVLLLQHRARWTDERQRDLALSLTASMAAGALSLAFFDAFAFPMTAGMLFLTVGLSGSLLRLQPNDARRSGRYHPARAITEGPIVQRGFQPPRRQYVDLP